MLFFQKSQRGNQSKEYLIIYPFQIKKKGESIEYQTETKSKPI